MRGTSESFDLVNLARITFGTLSLLVGPLPIQDDFGGLVSSRIPSTWLECFHVCCDQVERSSRRRAAAASIEDFSSLTPPIKPEQRKAGKKVLQIVIFRFC